VSEPMGLAGAIAAQSIQAEGAPAPKGRGKKRSPPVPASAPSASFGSASSLGAMAPSMAAPARRRSALASKPQVTDEMMSSYEEVAAPSPDEGASDDNDLADGASFDRRAGGGGPGSAYAKEANFAPEPGLGDELRDYDSLAMSGFDANPARRGRLHAASPWSAAFSVGVSVQVDVVVQLMNVARSRAGDVSYLSLPPGCTPVRSFDHFDYRFDCQGRLDVPSIGKWVTVSVMTCEVGLAAQYVCVPSVEAKVYRTLAIDNASTHALLPGPVDVSAGDEFLMTTELPAIAPGAKNARLGLGVEEAIKVARKTHYTETTGGFLGGSAVLPHEVSIELTNRLSGPATVEVRERVPWPDPSEKDVKLEETQITPAWEKLDKPVDGVLTNGARRWLVTVAAGQTAKLLAQYTIRIPADRMLVGGNRRS